MKRKIIIALYLVLCFYPKCFAEEEIVRLATTTSTYETGLLDYIRPPFEEKYHVKIHIISVGTGKAIKLGENGDVDVILVHARDLEDRFIKEGYGVNRRDVMYNDFIIIGPQDDPAGIMGQKDAKEALRRICSAGFTFVSRGDDSGTDKKEKYLWQLSRLKPKEDWYMETGQGMNATLRIADEKKAYCLIDRATYLFNKDSIRLKVLAEGDKDLFNPYGVIAVNPHKYPHVKYKLSMLLISWLTSPECQELIDNYTINGSQLFHAGSK